MAPRERGLFPGTVDLMILQSLADGPMHGFAISRDLRQRSDGVVDVKDAALYQALHRMDRSGWVASEWGVSENNRRAKYYRVTKAGMRRLAKEAKAWRRYAAAVFEILEPADIPKSGGKA